MLKSRSIRETVENGINNLSELQGSLLTAIQLEFSTIPPYLCAQWSINSDPSNVGSLIEGIVLQEMLHFGFVCNMFTATGGSLVGQIANPAFVPNYPTDGLPGGVHPGLIVSLQPVSPAALETFMAIEYPDVTPVVTPPDQPPSPQPPTPPTIGQFYQAIAVGFATVFPSGNLPNDPSLNQVSTSVGDDNLTAVNTVEDAVNAIGLITDQGEGSDTSPDEGTFDPTELAHYYTFAEAYYGYKVAQVGSSYQYSGAAVSMPTVYNFSSQGSGNQTAFIGTFTSLMKQLEACWTSGANIGSAIGTMFTLKSEGVTLIKGATTPEFTYQG